MIPMLLIVIIIYCECLPLIFELLLQLALSYLPDRLWPKHRCTCIITCLHKPNFTFLHRCCFDSQFDHPCTLGALV